MAKLLETRFGAHQHGVIGAFDSSIREELVIASKVITSKVMAVLMAGRRAASGGEIGAIGSWRMEGH